MEMDDSIRYQEAVLRLKRLLYDDTPQPSSLDYPQPATSTTHNLHHHQYHTISDVTQGTFKDNLRARLGGGGGDVVDDNNVGKRTSSTEGVARWLLELLHHQEALIVQLEKENEFLKREVLAVGDGVKKLAKENQELSRQFANSLSQALAQDETPGSCSSSSNVSIQDDKIPASTSSILREKELLASEVERLQSVVDAATEREHQALDKLRKALSLAEDTHTLTAQVRASSESALEELSNLLSATKEEERKLKLLLDEADRKAKDQQEQQEQWKSQQQQRIKLLQDEISDQNTIVNQLEGDIREKSRKIAALEEDFQVAQAAKARKETQLEEQRQHAKDAHSRLDHIITVRSAEADAATAKVRELEDRLNSSRQDMTKLLHTITTLAKGSGNMGELDTTDDVKSQRLAAEQQLSSVLSALQNKYEEEVQSLHAASTEHTQAMDALRMEVTAMRQQMTDENEKHRVCLQDIRMGLKALNYTTSGDKKEEEEEEEGDPTELATSTMNDGVDSGLASASSVADGVGSLNEDASDQDQAKDHRETIKNTEEKSTMECKEKPEPSDENKGDEVSSLKENKTSIDKEDLKPEQISTDGNNDPENAGDGASDDVIVELRKPSQCETCNGWSLIVEVVGEALDNMQLDLEKQGTRLERMMNTYSTQCANCLKYQLFLGATSYRLDKLNYYSNSLRQRIDSLTQRVMSW